MSSPRLALLIAAAAVAMLAPLATAFTPGPWYTGRATRYGSPGDPWTIHNGHCGYGYLDPNKATGWDVAAMSDSVSDWKNGGGHGDGACGRCYEIACNNAVFSDNYGQRLDRAHVCYDSNASVVVQITDLCPCHYPENAYSNKRWCCGDMWHLDLSHWTFEKLAEEKWGVIGIKFRWVPCNYQPANPAKKLAHPSQGSVPAPKGWRWDMDKRPWV